MEGRAESSLSGCPGTPHHPLIGACRYYRQIIFLDGSRYFPNQTVYQRGWVCRFRQQSEVLEAIRPKGLGIRHGSLDNSVSVKQKVVTRCKRSGHIGVPGVTERSQKEPVFRQFDDLMTSPSYDQGGRMTCSGI